MVSLGLAWIKIHFSLDTRVEFAVKTFNVAVVHRFEEMAKVMECSGSELFGERSDLL